ncbi:hypothetical protein LXL04_020129 [Taraxacum kok-saghyz]
MNNRNNNLMHTVYWHHADTPSEVSSISHIPSSGPGVVGRMGSFGSIQDRAYVLPFAFRVTSQPTTQNLSSNNTIQRNAHLRQASTIQSPYSAEPNKGLEKLKKEIYNPGVQRVSLYYRDPDFRAKLLEKTKNEDGKRCAVCLDDFEPGEIVTLTPCRHMFHENCIVPWVTSNGQCPVCRFVINDRSKEREETQTGNNRVLGGDPIPRDLINFIREMENRDITKLRCKKFVSIGAEICSASLLAKGYRTRKAEGTRHTSTKALILVDGMDAEDFGI